MRLGFSPLRMLSMFILSMLAGFGVISAQVTTDRGTMGLVEGRRYMVAFPKVWNSKSENPLPIPMQLFISSKVKAKVRIETPSAINAAARISKDVVLQPNVVFKLAVPVSYMSTESQVKTGYGISVVGDQPISVTTYQAWNGNGEMARHLPVEAWGKNYYSMNFYQDRYNSDQYRPSQILVIAEKNNTVVTFSPTFETQGGADAQGVAAGASGTVNLNRGETFLIESKIKPAYNKDFVSDLSGTYIKASKPIAVVSGHTKVAIMRYPDFLPPGGATEAHFVRNNVHDAMLPVEMAGTQFVTVPAMYTSQRVTGQVSAELGLDDDRGDVIRIVAIEANTVIKARTATSSSLQNVAKLVKPGDSYKNTSCDVATYWETDKPVLVGQYGKSWAKVIPPGGGSKDGDQTQGHPTVESGMPMLEYVPSVDRWVNYGVFTSPGGLNNFFNIVFKTEEVNNIRFDGTTLASRFGGSMRPIPGTPYSFIRTAVAEGDHVVESTVQETRFAGWCYGSLDGMEMGRSYGTPIAIDLAIACPDSLDVTETLVCGDVNADGKILPENTACGSIFAVYGEELNNYTLEVDPNFNSGDKKVHFVLNVINKREDASATVLVVSRSGKFVRKTYTYTADKISFTPASVDFGSVAINTPVTRTVTVKNESTTRPVTIREIRVKAYPGIFKVTPSAVTIPAGQEQIITVTGTITTVTPRIDTLVASLECYDQDLSELKIRGEEPLIYVSDANWGRLPASIARQKVITISNPSNVELIVTDYDRTLLPTATLGSDNRQPNAAVHFYNPTVKGTSTPLLSTGPIHIPAGGTYDFDVWYSPNDIANVRHEVQVPFLSNATGNDNIAILIGEGVQSDIFMTLPEWNVRVIDGVTTVEGATMADMAIAPNGKLGYFKDIRFVNIGKDPVTFTSKPTLSGPDAGMFYIDETKNNFGQYPFQQQGDAAKPNETKVNTVRVYFFPEAAADRSGERTYTLQAKLNVTPEPANTDVLSGSSISKAWLPAVKGQNLAFGELNEADPAVTLTIDVTNENFQDVKNNGSANGSHPVAVYDVQIVGANAGKFEIMNKPTAANPWIIAPGAEAVKMQVRFTPSAAGVGDYTGSNGTTYRLVTRPANMGSAEPVIVAGAASEDPTYLITASVVGGSFTVTDAYEKQYVRHYKDMVVRVRNSSNLAAAYILGDITNTDGRALGNTFQVINPANGQLDVAPNSTGEITIRFTPSVVTLLEAGQNPAIFNSANPAGSADAERYNKARNSGLTGELNKMYTAEFTLTDTKNPTLTATAKISGDGLFLETTNMIGDGYKVDVGKSVNVGIELKVIPEAITGRRIASIRHRIGYDNTLVRPVLNGNDVVLAGTQSAGWRVKSYNPGLATGEIEIDLVTDDDSKAWTNESSAPVVLIPFTGYLGRGTSNNMTSKLDLTTYWVDHSDVALPINDRNYVFFNDIDGKIEVNLTCATTKRLVQVSGIGNSVSAPAPNPVVNTARINYSIGLDGNTRIVLTNSTGQEILDLVNQYDQKGSYELTVDFSNLPSGVYYYRVISGAYVSDPIPVNVVR